MEKYIGLDAHIASCTLAIVGQSGRRLKSQVLETNAKVLVDFIRTIPGNRHLCLEEGTLSDWLYETLYPHTCETVVMGVRKSKGQKSDRLDAFGLAEKLRVGDIQTRVYKGKGELGTLGELSRSYLSVSRDLVKVMNRIKTLYRSRGVSASGKEVYSTSHRDEWVKKLPAKARIRAHTIYMEMDALSEIKKKAQKDMIKEARRNRSFQVLMSCPGMGQIRVAIMMPIVVTPYRFTNKRAFWSYCGLAIVMRSSSD